MRKDGDLSKRVLEKTYCGIWDFVGGFGGGSKEAWISSRLDAVR